MFVRGAVHRLVLFSTLVPCVLDVKLAFVRNAEETTAQSGFVFYAPKSGKMRLKLNLISDYELTVAVFFEIIFRAI